MRFLASTTSDINLLGPKHPSSHGQVPELHYARDAWSSPTQGAIAGLLVLSPQYLPRSRRQSSSWSSISPPETATVNRGHRLVNYEPGSGLLGCIYCSQEGSTPHLPRILETSGFLILQRPVRSPSPGQPRPSTRGSRCHVPRTPNLQEPLYNRKL